MVNLVKVAQNLNDKRANKRVIGKHEDKILIGTEFWQVEVKIPSKIPKSLQNSLIKHFNISKLEDIPKTGAGNIEINKYIRAIEGVLELNSLNHEVKEIKKDNIGKYNGDGKDMEIIELKLDQSNSVFIDSKLYSMIRDVSKYKVTATHEFGMVVFENEHSTIRIMPVRVSR